MPLCLRRFNDHWFIDIFMGDEDQFGEYMATHLTNGEYTDDIGLHLLAAVEALQVDGKQNAFRLFLSQVDINVLEVPGPLAFTSYQYMGPEEPRATMWLGYYKVLSAGLIFLLAPCTLLLAPYTVLLAPCNLLHAPCTLLLAPCILLPG